MTTPSDYDPTERACAYLAGTGAVREVRMFGGLCFMLNGNMVAGISKRGLLVRVGKEQHARLEAARRTADGDVGAPDGRLYRR